MEIAKISLSSLRIKGKHGVILVDPDSPKLQSDGVVLLHTKFTSEITKIEGQRLIIGGVGEYEIAGIKVSGFTKDGQLYYGLRVDGIDILLGKGETISLLKDTPIDYQIVIAYVTQLIGDSVIAAISPKVAIFYGDSAMEIAKTLGKETVVPVSKYVTTAEKLPAEMEVIVLG